MAEPWEPSLTEVGSRIPSKTRSVTTPGDNSPLGTFNDNTMPTGVMVEPIVRGAVAVIASRIGTIGSNLYPLALDATAWRAAADVELAYPERQGDVEIYEQLDARAKLALADLLAAAEDSGGGTDATVPAWSFPSPVPWGDDYL